MSIATDAVSYSKQPDRWHIRSLAVISLTLGSLVLIFSFGVLLAGRNWLQLPLDQVQTLVFITLVFTGQGMVYLVRERGHFWNSRPGKWLLLSSVADIAVVSILATRGILMEAIRPQLLFTIMIACVFYLTLTDFLKVSLLRRLPIGS
jgi:H+-transporting ATPase